MTELQRLQKLEQTLHDARVKGGRSRSKAKLKAARKNGKKPKKTKS